MLVLNECSVREFCFVSYCKVNVTVGHFAVFLVDRRQLIVIDGIVMFNNVCSSRLTYFIV